MLDETRAEVIADLVHRGDLAHLLVSMDRARRSELKSYGGPGYAFLMTHLVPLLRAGGLSDDALREILASGVTVARDIAPEGRTVG